MEMKNEKRIHPFFSTKSRLKAAQSEDFHHATVEKSALGPQLKNNKGETALINTALPSHDNIHVRQCDYIHDSKRRKISNKGKLSQRGKDASTYFLNELWDRSSKSRPFNTWFPTRILLPIGTKVDYLSDIRNIQIIIESTLYRSLLRPNKYDVGSFENQMWCDKYAPQTAHDLLQSKDTIFKFRDWLSAARSRQLDKWPSCKRPNRKKSSTDDFIVYGDEILEDSESDTEDDQLHHSYTRHHSCLFAGPTGSCKTASILAVANELGFEILEMNAGNRRSAKDVFEQVGDNSRNKLVNSEKSLILLEEVDILFEQDKNFWVAVEELIRITLRPVVMTTNNLSQFPENLCSGCAVFTFDSINHDDLAEYLISLAFSEGHLIEWNEVSSLIASRNNDLRGCLNDLQFWCQMGIGDRRGGLDWVVPWATTSNTHTHVISKDTLPKTAACNSRGPTPPKIRSPNFFKEPGIWSQFSRLHQNNEDCLLFWDNLSFLDAYIDNHYSSYSSPDALNTISSNSLEVGHLSKMETCPDSIPSCEYVTRNPQDEQENISLKITTLSLDILDVKMGSSAMVNAVTDRSSTTGTILSPVDIKDALTCIAVRSCQNQYAQKETGGWQFPDKVLAAEIAPLIRLIARSDKTNEETKIFCVDHHRASGNRRITRRALSTKFPHLKPNYLVGDSSKILATAGPNWV